MKFRPALAAALCGLAALHAGAAPLPRDLRDTGFDADARVRFSPQYPLWSDGAAKRRWLHIPAGRAIDASRPHAWQFPAGTKLWKEFSHGTRVETRFIERREGGDWRYATYVWNEDGTQATLAPERGAVLAVRAAPGGRYVVPGQADCRACHEGAAVPVLGVSALQLSPDRDPLAPHAEPRAKDDADLRALVARGWLRRLPSALLENPPRIDARSAEERAALGYLHGNCGHCHNSDGAPPPVDLRLAHAGTRSYAEVMRSLVGARSRYRAPSLPAASPLVAPGRPKSSVLLARMASRNPYAQMPPLGTQAVDAQAIALLESWISRLPTEKELSR